MWSDKYDHWFQFKICEDGTLIYSSKTGLLTSYCGYGSCNIFGCNCDGGCRTGWHVVLFDDNDFKGRANIVKGDGRCWNLDQFNDRTSSVNTRGNCVRLYNDADCEGEWIEVEPGSGGHGYVGDDYNDKISSVRSC
jgi:hypothetical protein